MSKCLRTVACSVMFAAALASAAPSALAQDRFKLIIGNINNWGNQAPQLGQDVGIFKKHGIVLEIAGSEGAGETMQAVISGSADIGAAVGVAGAMRAFSKGAPIRLIAPMFTGVSDVYWYVRGESPIKTLRDATDRHTIAYSSSGSTTDLIVTGFVKELGVKAKPTKTGGEAATFTQVMSGQIDIGWSIPQFGIKEAKEGKIRIVAWGSDIPSLRSQTIRALAANAQVLKQRKDAIVRFVKAYREAVEWMYSGPKAMEMYAKKLNIEVGLVRDVFPQSHPRAALQSEQVSDLQGIMRDAVRLKFLDKPLTKEQLEEFIQIPPAGK